jgi:hypothetical protein
LPQNAEIGLEKQNECAVFKLNCERKAGRLLIELNVHGGRPAKKKRSHDATVLRDLGIKKSQSSRWQREARVPDEVFERYLAWARENKEEVTSAGLLRLARAWESRSAEAPKRPRRGKRSKPIVIDSISLPPAEEMARLDAVREFVCDLRDHHRQLTKQLEEYCGEGKLERPKVAKRRYVGQLLREMDEMLSAATKALGIGEGMTSFPAK